MEFLNCLASSGAAECVKTRDDEIYCRKQVRARVEYLYTTNGQTYLDVCTYTAAFERDLREN